MSPIPPDGGDVNSPEYDVFAAPQVDVFADLPDSDGDPPENPVEPDLQMIGGQVAPPSKRPSKRIRVKEEQAEDDDDDEVELDDVISPMLIARLRPDVGDVVSSEGCVVALNSSG